MSYWYEPLVPAKLERDDMGAPFSQDYGDIYHAGAQPLQQAREVFLKGNGLPERWANMPSFTILETGFGAGHNFLATWQAWRQDSARCNRLHFVSIEAHPFTKADMGRLVADLPADVQILAQELNRAWPPLTPGIHRLEFSHGQVTLTLAFGKAATIARQLDLNFHACYLDGFSPRVNPEMWTPKLFGQLVRMAHQGATLATWCSASQVRRDLQNAGFLIERHPGFQGKRHRITGQLRAHLGRPYSPPSKDTVAVIGGGFSGASCAYALAQRGYEVTVIDPALQVDKAGVHRNHVAAALTPYLSRIDDARARVSRAGVNLARLRWRDAIQQGIVQHCGTFEPIAVEEQATWQQALEKLRLPAAWVRWVTADQAGELCGLPLRRPGIWHAYGHQVNPAALLRFLLQHQYINTQAAVVARLARSPQGVWHLYDANHQCLAQASVVVIAAAGQSQRLLTNAGVDLSLVTRLRGLHDVSGQLNHYADVAKWLPKAIIAGDGLCFPYPPAALIGGSTYEANSALSIIREKGCLEISHKLADLLEIPGDMLHAKVVRQRGWRGHRAAVRDHFPIMGWVPGVEGLWLSAAFGSRGLTWAAVSAELLASQLSAEPIPLERSLSRRSAPS